MRRTGTVLLTVTLALAGCTSESPRTPGAKVAPTSVSPSPAEEPRTAVAAQTAAQRSFDAFAAGDWAGAWDEWNGAGKAAFSREDYVRLHTTCKTLTGLPFKIKTARLEGADKAVVQAERASFAFAYEMTYEEGRWRFQPDADAMADYRLGVDALIAKKKTEGTCG